MTDRAPGHSWFSLNRRAALGLGAVAGLGFGSPAYGQRRNCATAVNGTSIGNFRDEPRPFAPGPVHKHRSYDRVNEASRIYLGIHWRFDQNRGTASGRRIAKEMYGKAYRVGKSLP